MASLRYFRPPQAIDHALTGRYARQERKLKKLTMQKIADRMDFALSYISQLERGKANWNNVLMEQYNGALIGKSVNDKALK
jgi:predicted transcriptional regulator